MVKKIIIILIFLQPAIVSLGQSSPCDYVQINNTDFDKLYQKEFEAIQADTILSIKHSKSTNSSGNAVGILCWKINKQYFYKKIQQQNGEIKSTTELRYGLINQLESFYKNKIYTITGDVPNNIYIDEGLFTKVVFKAKELCWHLELGSLNSNDIRVIWVKDLLSYYIRM